MKKWLFKLLGIVSEPPDGRPCLRKKNEWVEDEVASTTEVVESVKRILQTNNPLTPQNNGNKGSENHS